MNPVTNQQITAFRIKELQSVLTQLGRHNKGRKADLQKRLLNYFSEKVGQGAAGVPAINAAGLLLS